jgi:CRISPR-associated endonuclease/helicase Cas3
MVAWLLALAYQAAKGVREVTLPRRLVWVVNRRSVVDQATEVASKLKACLQNANLSELGPLREALGVLAADRRDSLAVSTLRGELADNADWREDPARAAIIVGTVDMIGSRVLFSAYGRGYKSKPLHAGFLGQDALIVHDEAHLEPAFQRLLRAIEAEQKRQGDLRPLRVMALTATAREGHRDEFVLEESERTGLVFQRLNAVKRIAFHEVPDEKLIASTVVKLALEFRNSNQAILIYLRKLEDVMEVRRMLQTNGLKVQTLTGTLRGYERDKLVKTSPIFARFLPHKSAAPESGTVYLVCTSAGEVGIDMSADHMVCDLTPFDSMAQRLGRVNRFGHGSANVEVICVSSSSHDGQQAQPGSQYEGACLRTKQLLYLLPQEADGRLNASPAALAGLPSASVREAFTPEPESPPLTDTLLDMWSLTTVRESLPARPPVEQWLHGKAEWQPPETYVAWRTEVGVVTRSLISFYDPEELLDDYPLKPHELLRDVTSRVRKHLELIGARHPDLDAWVIHPNGRVTVDRIVDLAGKEGGIDYCTVLLPPQAGGLKSGMLDGAAEFDPATERYDVADEWRDETGEPRRCRLWDPESPVDGMRLVRVISPGLLQVEDAEEVAQALPARWCWYVRPRSADDDGSLAACAEQALADHLDSCARIAHNLAYRLNLKEQEALAVELACRWHDLGKARTIWQRSVGNHDPNHLLAKSHTITAGRFPTGYRHEFGTVVELRRSPEFQSLDADLQELVLHLIAAHHGRARPHFPLGEVFDPDFPEHEVTEVAKEIPSRYARLQARYGRWGLAFLESLLRAADAKASQADPCFDNLEHLIVTGDAGL